MLAILRAVRYCSFFLLLVCAIGPLRASVAYISNCCQYPSTVTVVDTRGGAQKAQWNVGTGAFAAVFSPDGKKAYVSNNVSLDITVVRVSSGATLATIPVGFSVQWMAITPNGRRLFVQSFDSANTSHLTAIDTKTNTVVRTLTFSGLGPLVVSPDGKTLYTNGSARKKSGLLEIDTATLAIKAAVPVYVGTGVAVTPDGRFLYVPNFGSFNFTPNVAVIDTSTNQTVATVPLDPNLDPNYIQISPDGSMAWVSAFPLKRGVTPAVTVISTSTNQVAGQIHLLRKASPSAIVFAPSGKHAYVTANGSTVNVVNVARMKAVSEIRTLGLVVGLAVSPDGATLLLPNTGSSRAAAISQSNGTTLASIPVGDMDLFSQLYLEYGGVAISPDGSRAYVTNYDSNNITVIDTALKKVVTSVPTGDSPVGVVFSPDGMKAYVANSYANSVTMINTATYATSKIEMPHHTYPSALAITPDGSRVYVAGDNPQPDFGRCHCYVFALDTATGQVVSSISLDYPVALGSSPDGSRIYVVAGNTALYTISTATNTIVNSVILGAGGSSDPVTGGLVVTLDGKRVFATDGQDGSVFEVDVVANKLLSTIPVGTNAGVVALTPDGAEVWVADYHSPNVSVIDVPTATVTRTVPLGNPSYGIAFGPQ